MKATGIVRRIDDLGRVVIPKEIRRTMHIREGDPLEIFTDANGEVIFKKYSQIAELGNFASQYADALQKVGGAPVAICDREQIVAVSGLPKRDIIEKKITSTLDKLLQSRSSFVNDSGKQIYPIDGIDKVVSCCMPIVSGGDLSGGVMFISDQARPADQSQVKLLQAAAMFLGKQMED